MSRPAALTPMTNANAGSVANTTDADTGRSLNTIDAMGSKLSVACAFHGPTRVTRGGIVGSTTFPGVQPQRGEWAVAVYCAAGPTSPDLLALAAQVGEAIADRGWTMVWGGGRLSAMGAVASAARAHGGWTVGVMPKMLVNRELADRSADELIFTDTMKERKQIMEDLANAFLVLPGGVGTLDEMLDAWTGRYLGEHEKPVVMLDPDGHYEGLRAWLTGLIATGYLSDAAMEGLVMVDEVDAALAVCAPSSRWLAPLAAAR
jgi:uncharacterized protein (TIGR00730 family)